MLKPENNKENFSKCICEKCPVYTACNKEKNQKLFCAMEISECDMNTDKMCICGMCKIYNESNLSGGYFCKNEIIN
jgi:aldose sugar dehydrogenase